MLNELADRLETAKNSATEHIAKDEYQAAQILNFKMATMVWQQCESIIKALRFAADMERLVSAGEDPVFALGHNCVWIDGCTVAELGPDIYTAVSKAVEELEKGEGK